MGLSFELIEIYINDVQGSEWVEPVQKSPNKGGSYSPPPLEQLISAPLPPAAALMDDQVSITSATTDAASKELVRLEAKVILKKVQALPEGYN